MTTAPLSGSSDETHMRRALALAREGWGRVAPNPMVGAVVVSDERLVGEGFHAVYGGEHAEVAALTAAGSDSTGATLYVGLEPCSHHGKTPPCTRAIMRAGIQRVVFGCRDVDREAGGGAAELRSAGLEVAGGVLGLEAARLNAPFIWERLGRGPWVSLKLAMSLDGKIAARHGERTTITGPETSGFVHRLRAGHDAVLIGARTAIVDDPLLTVRAGPSPRVPPTRVVLDPGLELPPGGQLVRSVDEAPLVVLCLASADAGARRELEARGVRVETVDGGRAGLDLARAVDVLHGLGLKSILVEGGGRLASAFLDRGLVRRQYLVYAPAVLGPDGVPAFAEAVDILAADWRVVDRSELGRDALLELEDEQALDALKEAA